MDDFSHHVSDDQQPFGDMEFADNPEPRAACLLLLDTSGSMKGEAIAALNAGLLAFAEALRADRLSAKRVDVAVGPRMGDKVSVAKGLNADQRVAIDGVTALEDGMKVRTK